MEAFAGLYLFIILFLIVLAICWIILPFAILGTKPLLYQLLAETRRTNELLLARNATIPPPEVARARDSRPVLGIP